jgi:hypothetical protein
MMYSFPPVPEDRAGAIITLVGLGHERRGYAGIPVDTRGRGIQAGYVELTSTTRIHMNLPMQIRLPVSIRRRVAEFKQQIDEAFYLYEQDVSTGNFDLVPQDRQDSLY